MANRNRQGIKEKHRRKGIKVFSPESIQIGPEVNSDRIAGNGVKIHAEFRIFGAKPLLLPGVALGAA